MSQKAIQPTNQKAIYHSFTKLYAMIMNDEIPLEKADKAIKALSGANKVFAQEIKRAELQRTPERRIESTAFDDTTLQQTTLPNGVETYAVEQQSLHTDESQNQESNDPQ